MVSNTEHEGGRTVSFALTKWYVDCVAPDGRVAIGYWASLAWRHVTLTWQQLVLHTPGESPARRSTLTRSPPPAGNGETIRWNSPNLGCAIEVQSRQPPFGERLFVRRNGVLDWRVDAPASAVSVALDGSAPLHGSGYCERIVISIPPWSLPIHELRWGRWIDTPSTRSVVWIDWRGDAPSTWVFADGERATAAVVTDDGVSADSFHVAIGTRRVLDDTSFASIAAAIPPLESVVPESLLGLRQTRWCSDGTMQRGNAEPLPGRAIHELVTFR